MKVAYFFETRDSKQVNVVTLLKCIDIASYLPESVGQPHHILSDLVQQTWNTMLLADLCSPSQLCKMHNNNSIIQVNITTYKQIFCTMQKPNVSGHRSRGRQRRRWTEHIADWTILQINTAVRVTEDRHRWHHVILIATDDDEKP